MLGSEGTGSHSDREGFQEAVRDESKAVRLI